MCSWAQNYFGNVEEGTTVTENRVLFSEILVNAE
jgi:hypothetical protein